MTGLFNELLGSSTHQAGTNGSYQIIVLGNIGGLKSCLVYYDDEKGNKINKTSDIKNAVARDEGIGESNIIWCKKDGSINEGDRRLLTAYLSEALGANEEYVKLDKIGIVDNELKEIIFKN